MSVIVTDWWEGTHQLRYVGCSEYISSMRRFFLSSHPRSRHWYCGKDNEDRSGGLNRNTCRQQQHLYTLDRGILLESIRTCNWLLFRIQAMHTSRRCTARARLSTFQTNLHCQRTSASESITQWVRQIIWPRTHISEAQVSPIKPLGKRAFTGLSASTQNTTSILTRWVSSSQWLELHYSSPLPWWPLRAAFLSTSLRQLSSARARWFFRPPAVSVRPCLRVC